MRIRMGMPNWQKVSFDWNQARAFLATAEEGSLSAAARALGLTQPTLGRQVAALESDLGLTLFERGPRTMDLTEAGLELLDHVRTMGEAAERLSLSASGQSSTIEGEVCLTASDVFSVYHLPPILERLRVEAPGVEIEVVASNEIRDLRRREADIAIRHVRPKHQDLVAKLLRETTWHFYAAPSYIERHGRPESVADLADSVWVSFGARESFLASLSSQGLPLTMDNLKYACDSGLAGWEMVKQGLGMSVMTRDVAEMTPEVEMVLPDYEASTVPVWLVTHREIHTSRRIRLVFDVLADALS